MEKALFYGFSAALIYTSLMVVSLRNPVRAALSLVISFVLAAPLWLMAGAEFLALVLIFVYVGAVMTLFLFVIMMLNLQTKAKDTIAHYWPLGLVVLAGLLSALIHAIQSSVFAHSTATAVVPSNTKALGAVLYTQYALPFELAGAVLLTAIVASISLAFRGPRHRKTQSVDEQVAVDPKTRIELIDMPAEKKS